MSTETSSAVSALPVDAEHPWLGLASFTEETRAFFHGRDDDAAELARRVQRKQLTVLFGQSGHGKTSLLRAGLVPRLRPEGFCPVYVRLDYAADSPPPAEQIKEAIFRATRAAGHWTKTGSSIAGESLWEFLHHRDDVLQDKAGRPLIPLIIFDQFEEIFTLAQGDNFGRERAQNFLRELADLVENRPPVALEQRIDRDETDAAIFDFARADYRILIALREDYLAHLEGLKGTMPSVTQNRVRLARFTGAQALAAVRAPAPALVTEDVAAQIVSFVAGGAEVGRSEVEPSLLSLVCRELNNARLARGQDAITADLLAGSRETILVEFYERTLADQPAGVRAFIEDELLTDSGYRESIAEERVKKAFAAAGAGPDVLRELVDRRLLRIEERLDVRRVELTHDVLCGVVKTSRDARQARESKAAMERQLAETHAKEIAGRRALQRSRSVALVCAALAVFALAGALLGYINLRRARVAEQLAEKERDRVQVSRGEAESLVTFLLDDLYTQLEPTGRIEIVSGLARRALSYFDALPAELRDARSDRYRAIALSRLGQALATQGKTQEAETPLIEAEKAFRALPAKAADPINLAVVLRQQSRNAYLQNRPKVAIDLAQQALALIESKAQESGAAPGTRLEHARSLMNLGFVLMRDREHVEAMNRYNQARELTGALRSEPEVALRAKVLYAEVCAWTAEVARFMGRAAEFDPLVAEGLQVANEAVAQEAGNLGALRARALLSSRLTQREADRYRYAESEAMARQTAADWAEFLRFDASNDTAKNNRRVALGYAADAAWRQGKLDAAKDLAKANVREIVLAGGSPSSVRGAAFAISFVANLEAELGQTTNVDAVLADVVRMRELTVKQVEEESYFRQAAPAWNEIDRADLEGRLGNHMRSIEISRAAAKRMRQTTPRSGIEVDNHRNIFQRNLRVQLVSLLALRNWQEAADAGRELVKSRPAPDDNSPTALELLATDRALAAVALARADAAAEARALLDQAAEHNRAVRAAGANDHDYQYQSALVALAGGLLSNAPAAKRAAFTAGLAEIAAMPPQPQQLRSVKDLREVLQAELARLPS